MNKKQQLDYPTHLKSLEQYSLEKLRIVHDLVLTYKIVFSIFYVQTSKSFTLRNDVALTGGNPCKVLLNVKSHEYQMPFFHRTYCLYLK